MSKLVAVALLATLSLAVLGLLAGAPTAWGCSRKEEGANGHCYSIERYSMNKEKGEQVVGAFANMELYYGATPAWHEGDRQNAEIWVDLGSQRWVEGGAVIGSGYNAGTGSESTPTYFVAREYGPPLQANYWEFDWQGAGPGYNNWYGLYIDQPHGVNGEWCTTWAWDSTPDFCFPDFAAHSAQLETGLEYATSQASGANTNGRSVGWDQWTDFSWHASWHGAYGTNTAVRQSPLCINAPAPGYTWGSVAFSAPGC